MKLRETPEQWRSGFHLYRRRIKTDTLGNEVAFYDMTAPDATVCPADGLCVQSPQSWNSAGNVGKTGHRVEEQGETAGGVLEGYLKDGPVIDPYDRLEIDGELWEVRASKRFPHHRQLLMQRVR